MAAMAALEESALLDLNGLIEGLVDNVDDDLDDTLIDNLFYSTSLNQSLAQDWSEACLPSTQLLLVKEVLEKDPSERNYEDHLLIFNFLNTLKAFDRFDNNVKKKLAYEMILAIIEKEQTVILTHNEILDSFCCLIHGTVEHISTLNSVPSILYPGDVFGITEPTMEKVYFDGIMKTLTPHCWFLCVCQQDFCKILNISVSEYCKHEEDGRIVLITEHKTIDNQTKGHIIIRGTPDKLLSGLLDCDLSDPYYIDDFILTYRVFMPSSNNENEKQTAMINGMDKICLKLLSWFDEPHLLDKVIRIVLTWINNYYLDFDLMISENCGQRFLDLFEAKLYSNTNLSTQLSLLRIALSTKAKVRHVTLTRPNREEVLHFSILGGYERGFGIFVSKVDAKSKAESLGLKRGDQILEVNGINFTIISHVRALEVLRTTTHLQLTIKYNPFMFSKMIDRPEDLKNKKFSLSSALLPSLNTSVPLSPNMKSTFQKKNKCQIVNSNVNSRGGGGGTKIKKAIPKFAHFISRHLPNFYQDLESSTITSCETDSSPNCSHKGLTHRSLSNPDLHTISNTLSSMNETANTSHPSSPPHVVRVFNGANGDSRYLLIHEETTAREIVMVSVREFGLCNQSGKPSSGESGFAKSSLNYALYEVSVVPEANNTIKQRRLPDQLSNLAEKAALLSRYYIKENSNSSSNSSNNELSAEILKECPMPVTILSLNSNIVATELTIQDFNIFRSIEPQSYIYDLFEIKSFNTQLDEKCKKEFNEFESLSNKEMFWVINEILNENSLVKRVKIIKYFTQVANMCRHLHNFNSLFAILSGLGHGSVQRLKQTWDKLPTKYNKLLKNLQSLMDPSRNMMNYRREVNCSEPPIVPFFPIVKKDLTFIHLAHHTFDESNLVNFEKLRMISKEIRNIMNMSSQPYIVSTPFSNLLNSCTSNGRRNTYTPKYSSNYLNDVIGAVPLPPPPPTAAGSSVTVIKRLYEEMLMRKKVKHYLNLMFSSINYDEDQLLAKSNELEPGQNNNLQGPQNNSSRSINVNPSPKQPHPSPTLSSASSGSSSGRLKFGAESPHQLRKLLSLSELECKTSSHKSIQMLTLHNQLHQRSSLSQMSSQTSHLLNQAHIRSINDGSNNLGLNNLMLNYQSQSVKQPSIPLSVESSSVTSLRRLEQFQKIPKFSETHKVHSHNYYQSAHLNNIASYRPRPPDYDEAVQRQQKLASLSCSTVPSRPPPPQPPLSVSNNNMKKPPISKLEEEDTVSAV